MSIEGKKALAVGRKVDIESICGICTYGGCTNCPSLVPARGRIEKLDSFPQIKKGIEIENGRIIVLECDWFNRKYKQKIKQLKRTEFVWNLKEGRHVKKS